MAIGIDPAPRYFKANLRWLFLFLPVFKT